MTILQPCIAASKATRPTPSLRLGKANAFALLYSDVNSASLMNPLISILVASPMMDCSLRSDFMQSFRDPALEAVFRMHTKPGDVIVVPPVGSEFRYILYVVIEGIENDRDKLTRCYSDIFEKAGEYHFQSIALPLFPAYESTSLTPSQIYSIVRCELRHRPADESLVIRLAMGRQGKIPVYKNLIADVRDYIKDARRQFFLSACAPSADASQDKNTYARPRAKCNLPKMPAPDSPKEGMLPQLSNSSRPESFSAEAELVDAEAADFGSDKYYLVPDEDARVPDYQKKITAESLEPFEDINIPLNLQIIDGSFFDPARNTLTLEEGFAEAVLKKIDEKGLTFPRGIQQAQAECHCPGEIQLFPQQKHGARTRDRAGTELGRSKRLAEKGRICYFSQQQTGHYCRVFPCPSYL